MHSSMKASDEIRAESEQSYRRTKPYLGNSFDVWALGITIVIGGGYFSWNSGLGSGFGSFSIATFLTGTAYMCLTLGTSEMLSALPFAGGAYGITRCTLGFFPGFLVGCMEAIEYIIYTSLAAEALVSMISLVLGIGPSFNPLMMLTFYVVSSYLHISGGKFLWQFIRVLGSLSLIVMVIYCFGAFSKLNFLKYSNAKGKYFVGGFHSFMHSLPLASWFYVGIESLAFSCDLVVSPKIAVPKGMISCMATLFLMSFFVLFTVSSLPPGIERTSQELVVFNPGFVLFLNCSEQFATVFSLPATFATGFGFIFSYGNLLYALASSKLVPHIFSLQSASDTPYAAILLGSLASYIICILVDCVPTIQSHLFNICMLSAYISYCCQCVGYIALKIRFQSLNRQFKSPLGIWGALYALLVFSFCGISIIGFVGDKQAALICFGCLLFMLSLYYNFYVKHSQTFSPDEERILFVAHVINYNISAAHQRRNRVRKFKASGNESSSFRSSRVFVRSNKSPVSPLKLDSACDAKIFTSDCVGNEKKQFITTEQ